MAILLWPLLAFSQTLNRQQAAPILQRSEFFSQTENVRLVFNIDLRTRSEHTLALYGALENAGIVTIKRERYAMGPVAYASLTPRGQSMCGQPRYETSTISVADCVVARREVLAVTGVASQGRQAEVEAYWWMRPLGIGPYLPVGAPYGGARSTDVLRPWSSIFRTNFTMRLWDDGWRLSAPDIPPMISGGDRPLDLEQLPAEVRQRMQSAPPLGFAPPPSPPTSPAVVPPARPAVRPGAAPPAPAPQKEYPTLPGGVIGSMMKTDRERVDYLKERWQHEFPADLTRITAAERGHVANAVKAFFDAAVGRDARAMLNLCEAPFYFGRDVVQTVAELRSTFEKYVERAGGTGPWRAETAGVAIVDDLRLALHSVVDFPGCEMLQDSDIVVLAYVASDAVPNGNSVLVFARRSPSGIYRLIGIRD